MLHDYRVFNVLAQCRFPFHVDCFKLAKENFVQCMFEPELSPAALYKIDALNVSARIFTSGLVSLFGTSVNGIQKALKQLHPIVAKFSFDPKPTSVVEKKPLLTEINKNTSVTRQSKRGPGRRAKKSVNYNEDKENNVQTQPINKSPVKRKLKHSDDDGDKEKNMAHPEKVLRRQTSKEPQLATIDETPSELKREVSLDFEFMSKHFELDYVQE